MNNKSHSRLASSLSIEELLNQPDSRPTQNWLLTYIDVFVLIVMLVVTLVALSSFETGKTTTEKKTKPEMVKKIAKPKPVQPSFQPEIAVIEREAPEVTINPKPPAAPVKKINTAEKQEKQIIVAEKNTEHLEQEKIQKPAEEKQVQTIEVDAQLQQEKQIIVAENAEYLEQEEIQEPAEEKHAQTIEVDTQQQLNKQLEKLGLKDSINIKVTQGYAQLEIQDNILYQSSEAKLTDLGRSVLKRLTPLLQQSTGLIYIEGHTDNRPIKTTQFPSNWELGAARATSVLHFLASQQIEASRMRAVTYAYTKPIADNKTKQGRQKNRRVNIVIKVSDKID